jgi:muramoyltetrapeptide carboxypeptidase LdcA involved in peptidoglycan recycling
MIRPPFLKQGDTVGITCPARFITTEEIQLAIDTLKSWGLNVLLGETLEKKIINTAARTQNAELIFNGC